MKRVKHERETFGAISELYDQARPSYPSALIDDIIAFSKAEKGKKILDIGCGTGQATLLFAERGFSVTGLDLSKEMTVLAKRTCSQFPEKKFIVGTFEETPLPTEFFNLLVSGMAWHWIVSESKYEKAHHLLKKNGTLALFWYHQRGEKSAFLRDAGLILDKYGGKKAGPAGSRVVDITEAVFKELQKSPLFSRVTQKEYFEELIFSKEKYLNLVLSYGWVQMLSEKDRKELMKDFKELFMNYGKLLLIPYRFVLVMAKKTH